MTAVNACASRKILWLAMVLALADACVASAASGDARSSHYRVIAGSPASVAGKTASPTYQAYVVGGSGAAVGIAASANTSIVAGQYHDRSA